MEPRIPTALDDFLFDLNGYLVLKKAVDPELLAELNDAFDRLPPLQQGEWFGNAQRRDYNGATGYELHNCIEFDPSLEKLIDHPSWINYLRRYCGEENSYVQGSLSMNVSPRSVDRVGIILSIRAAIWARCVASIPINMASSAADNVTLSWR